MNENNKPISMIIKETKTKIANACNESRLPPVILDLVISEIYSEVRSLAEKQSIEEEKAYMDEIQNDKTGLVFDDIDE